MTTSQTQLRDELAKPKIRPFYLGYFQESYREQIHAALVELFETAKGGLTKGSWATKANKRPEQVSRWISSPSNYEADTISDLALALGYVPRVTFEKLNLDDGIKPNMTNKLSDFVKEGGYNVKIVASAQNSHEI